LLISLLRFASVGVINTSIDAGLFFLLTTLGAAPLPANVVSYGTGILASFVMNRSWTFRLRSSRIGISRQFSTFLAVNLCSLALSTAIIVSLVPPMPAIAAKLLSVPPVFALNFLVSRFWIFR
jgi:putative flippase GtrA